MGSPRNSRRPLAGNRGPENLRALAERKARHHVRSPTEPRAERCGEGLVYEQPPTGYGSRRLLGGCRSRRLRVRGVALGKSMAAATESGTSIARTRLVRGAV